MENGQSVLFSLASPALRIWACEAQALALTLLLPYSKPILEKKTDRFAIYLETGHVNLSRQYRESQTNWFAKRGIPWHIQYVTQYPATSV